MRVPIDALVVGFSFLALSCTSLGSKGDDCVTPADCEVGLECYGGLCTAAALECGEGTEEVQGACKPLARVRCGSGTVEQDGVCVPKPEPDAGPAEPDAGLDAGLDAGPDAGGV
jgi:hypothetical protein